MSSIMRARNALTGRGEEAEVIGGVLFELKVAGPSMLGIGCPDRHPLPLIHSPPPPKMHSPRRRPPARAGSFLAPKQPMAADRGIDPFEPQKPGLHLAIKPGPRRRANALPPASSVLR